MQSADKYLTKHRKKVLSSGKFLTQEAKEDCARSKYKKGNKSEITKTD